MNLEEKGNVNVRRTDREVKMQARENEDEGRGRKDEGV